MLSGYVFQDGTPVEVPFGESLPLRIGQVRDGRRTPDDTPLPGVTVELRDGITGQAVTAEQRAAARSLSVGSHHGRHRLARILSVPRTAARPVRGLSATAGGLCRWSRHAGNDLGVVFNAGEVVNESVLQQLTVDPQNDAIVSHFAASRQPVGGKQFQRGAGE